MLWTSCERKWSARLTLKQFPNSKFLKGFAGKMSKLVINLPPTIMAAHWRNVLECYICYMYWSGPIALTASTFDGWQCDAICLLFAFSKGQHQYSVRKQLKLYTDKLSQKKWTLRTSFAPSTVPLHSTANFSRSMCRIECAVHSFFGAGCKPQSQASMLSKYVQDMENCALVYVRTRYVSSSFPSASSSQMQTGVESSIDVETCLQSNGKNKQKRTTTI